jgi:hypothetical protein
VSRRFAQHYGRRLLAGARAELQGACDPPSTGTSHRRTGRGAMPWKRFLCVLRRYLLPPPIVVHSVYRT